MTAAIKAAKKALRAQMTARRKALTPECRAAASRQMLQKLYALPVYQRAETVFLYASMPDEVQLYDLMERALAAGKTVCLPLITGKGTMAPAVNGGTRDRSIRYFDR